MVRVKIRLALNLREPPASGVTPQTKNRPTGGFFVPETQCK